MKTLFTIPKNSKVKDTSCIDTSRIRIEFSNGYELSVIRGKYSYGGPEGLFEIAPIGRENDLNGDLLNFECDDVLGWLTIDQVNEYITKMNNLK